MKALIDFLTSLAAKMWKPVHEKWQAPRKMRRVGDAGAIKKTVEERIKAKMRERRKRKDG